MKAYVLEGIDNLQYEEVPIPKCNSGWAIVQVKASGICSSDIPRIFVKGTYHFPTIPGHEFSGIVVDVGDRKDEYLIGKRVGVFPLIPCRACEQCKQQKYELCSDYDYCGSRRDGGFAEYAAVPVWNLIELPDSIDYKSAAMLEPLAVAMHAVEKSGITEGDSLAVIGTGMIGLAVAYWANIKGAFPIYIIGRSTAKKQLVTSLGLQNAFYLYTDEKLEDVDYAFEAVGSPETIQKAIEVVKPEGTVILTGNPSDNILFEQDVYWKILRKQLTIKGTWNSSYKGNQPSDWTKVVDALTQGQIDVSKMISHTFSKEQLKDGLQIMKDHKIPYCKVMIDWEQ